MKTFRLDEIERKLKIPPKKRSEFRVVRQKIRGRSYTAIYDRNKLVTRAPVYYRSFAEARRRFVRHGTLKKNVSGTRLGKSYTFLYRADKIRDLPGKRSGGYKYLVSAVINKKRIYVSSYYIAPGADRKTKTDRLEYARISLYQRVAEEVFDDYDNIEMGMEYIKNNNIPVRIEYERYGHAKRIYKKKRAEEYGW